MVIHPNGTNLSQVWNQIKNNLDQDAIDLGLDQAMFDAWALEIIRFWEDNVLTFSNLKSSRDTYGFIPKTQNVDMNDDVPNNLRGITRTVGKCPCGVCLHEIELECLLLDDHECSEECT